MHVRCRQARCAYIIPLVAAFAEEALDHCLRKARKAHPLHARPANVRRLQRAKPPPCARASQPAAIARGRAVAPLCWPGLCMCSTPLARCRCGALLPYLPCASCRQAGAASDRPATFGTCGARSTCPTGTTVASLARTPSACAPLTPPIARLADGGVVLCVGAARAARGTSMCTAPARSRRLACCSLLARCCLHPSVLRPSHTGRIALSRCRRHVHPVQVVRHTLDRSFLVVCEFAACKHTLCYFRIRSRLARVPSSPYQHRVNIRAVQPA